MTSPSLNNNLATLATQPIVLACVVLLVVGVSLFSAYQRLSPPNLSHIESSGPDLINDTDYESSMDIRDIVEMDLFGTAQVTAPVAVDKSPEDIPETNLRLALKGAFSHSVPEKASALIARDQNSKAELYFVDAELPGGAVLDTVYPDYVVIRRNGQREKLQFLRSQPGQSQSTPNRTSYQQYSPPAPVQSTYTIPESNDSTPAPYQAPASQRSSSDPSAPNSLADIQNHLLKQRQKLRQQQQK